MNAAKEILLVEDDRVLRKAVEAALIRSEYRVRVAADGEEALREVRAARPDLILLDLLMPKVNGIEVLRAVRAAEATRDVPVLILSNSSRERDMAQVRALGVVGYFVKADLSLDELTRKVAAALEG
jgi:DNA-binding response OmpR family regulator